MCTREKYWEWEVCDEKAGSWGNQGLEVACAAWLSGGRVLVNQDTWYAHMFRTQGGDFSFPYEQRGRAVQKTKQYIKDKFWNIKHPMQKHPVSWLVKRFWPVNGWTEDDLKKLEQELEHNEDSTDEEVYNIISNITRMTERQLVYRQKVIEINRKLKER